MPKDLTELQNLLTLDENSTIYDVLGRMEILLDLFKDDKEFYGLHPFLYTYYLVTKKVTEKYLKNKNYYTSIPDLQRLDVYFASLYFTPLLKFLENGECITPWKTYFTYCKEEYPIPFVQILLGINAHINTDLYTSLVKLKYPHEKDFFKINDVLQEVIPQIMLYLLERHDFVGISNIVLSNFIKNEFHQTIEHWRSIVWANAALTNSKDFAKNYEHIAKQTEELGEKIILLFHDAYILKNLTTFIPSLNTLSVKILPK